MHNNTKQAMNKLGGEVSKKWKDNCKGNNNNETSRDEKYTLLLLLVMYSGLSHLTSQQLHEDRVLSPTLQRRKVKLREVK